MVGLSVFYDTQVTFSPVSNCGMQAAAVENIIDKDTPTPGPNALSSDEQTLLEEIYPNIKLDDLRVSLDFVFGMQAASLDDPGSGLDADTLQCPRNPPTYPASFNGDKALEAAIKLYIGLNHLDEDYNVARETIMSLDDLDEFPSYYQAKKKTMELSGVQLVILDMCINSCVGFTGPFFHCLHCPECGESHYDIALLQDTQEVVRKPHKQFSTILLGP